MKILGIETSCDDTSAAVVDGDRLLSNVVSTQLIHRRFGGVVPELASRAHMPLIVPVIRQALDQASLPFGEIEGIAVTYGPGLAGSLIVGLSLAKGLALSLDVPLIGIHHLEGHLWSVKLAHPEVLPPFVILIASGGHTLLVHVPSWGVYHLLGRTKDDAAGEAFDKVSKLLGLGYPGGPLIEKAARQGDPHAIRFPRALLAPDSLDFSFSGLKTSVLLYVRAREKTEIERQIPDIAAGFQAAVIEVLVEKTRRAAIQAGVRTVCLAGGVAANVALQNAFQAMAEETGLRAYWPPLALCGDNAAMIARAGLFHLERGESSPLTLSPRPVLPL